MNSVFNFILGVNNISIDVDSGTIQTNGRVAPLKKIQNPVRRRILLKFSSACNLDCIYCFQREDRQKLNYNPDYKVLEHFSPLITNSDTDIYLFGGEPLLQRNLPIISELLSKYDRKMFVFTNGCFPYSFKKIFDRCNSLLIPIITLDGLKGVHDTRRVLKNGSSYQLIISNLLFLSSIGTKFHIQVNIDMMNIQSVPELLSVLESMNDIKPLSIILNPVLHSSTSVNSLEILKLFFTERGIHQTLNFRPNITTFKKLNHALLKHEIYSERCGISKTIVLDFANNSIYCCPESSGTEIGVLSDFDWTGEWLESTHRLVTSNEKRLEPCLNCSYKYFCGNCCPIEKVRFPKCKTQAIEELQFILEHANDMWQCKAD